MKVIAKILADSDSVSRILQIFANNAIGFRILNSLSGSRRVYGSFPEAESACHKLQLSSHEHSSLIKSNFSLSFHVRPSDYPILFWLSRIGLSGDLKVFDFGGGIGQTYYQYSTHLKETLPTEWTVMDLQEVIDNRDLATKSRPPNLKFTSSIGDCNGCNVFLAAGSLHYWEQPIADLGIALGGMPEHILINRSPISNQGKSFVTIQKGQQWAVPCWVRSREEIVNEFSELGYEVVDEWRVIEKTLGIPLLPQYTAPYSGLYLRRSNSR